jgi:hypothetical protein
VEGIRDRARDSSSRLGVDMAVRARKEFGDRASTLLDSLYLEGST